MMIRTPSDPGIPYVHEIRSVAPKDTGVKIVWGSCQDRVIIWGSWLMIKADFHLCRDVHMCGQERSWQVFKKQQQYLSTSVGAALKWQKRPRKNMKNKKHMCVGTYLCGGKSTKEEVIYHFLLRTHAMAYLQVDSAHLCQIRWNQH